MIQKLGFVQKAGFPSYPGFTIVMRKPWVRSWEQGKRLPQPIACRFLSEIESGRKSGDVQTLRKIADLLKISLDDLVVPKIEE